MREFGRMTHASFSPVASPCPFYCIVPAEQVSAAEEPPKAVKQE